MSGTTHRATQENGPSVVDGNLLWSSASGITTADPHSFGGCTLSWWYDKVGGNSVPETEAMRGGTKLHAEVQDHLLTGASLTSALALAGRMFIPHPGSGLLVEKPIHFVASSGVHIFGHVDLYNFRQEYIGPDGGPPLRDPAYSFEVKDWKTTSSFQYAKSERELGENIQLNTYAEAGFREWPDLEHARLTHAYFLTKGRPDSKLVTIRRSREQIASRWEYAESVIRLMADAAKEPTANPDLANRKSCDAYRGCPHRGICVAYRSNSLDALYGKIAQDFTQETAPMGLLSNNPQILQNAPQAPAQPDMRAQLAQEEAQMRAQAAQQQQQMPQANPHAQLSEVCARLGSYGYGFPTLSGNAAQAYAEMGGQRVPPGFVYNGIPAPAGARRSLHSLPLTEVQHLFQLEGELAQERAKEAPPVQAPAPVAQPAQQQQFVQPIQYNQAQQQYTTMQGVPLTPQPTVGPPVMSAGGILPPGAPESMPQLAMQHQAPPPGVVTGPQGQPLSGPDAYTAAQLPPPAPEKPKASRGRPKKDKDAAPEGVAASVALDAPNTNALPSSFPPAMSNATQAPPVTTSASDSTPRINNEYTAAIFVNARCYGIETKSLAGYVDYINAKLSKMYSVTEDGKPGIQDVRCVPKTSPLAFGGWKGAVREVIKAEPPPEDAYHFDTCMDELNEAVADALRVVAESRGWQYVRGIR